MSLSHYSVQQLKDEIERRQRFKELPPQIPISSVDWAKPYDMAVDHVRSIANQGTELDNDDEHYLYEALLEAIYGEGIWAWLNRVVR